jgi:hypothetical protein
MNTRRAASCVVVIAILMLAPFGICQSTRTKQSRTPPKGFVPDSLTAVRIAEAVLIPVYGEKTIQSERPFTASLTGDIWTVSGTLYCSDGKGGMTTTLCIGGTAEVKLSKLDGRILSMIHYK